MCVRACECLISAGWVSKTYTIIENELEFGVGEKRNTLTQNQTSKGLIQVGKGVEPYPKREYQNNKEKNNQNTYTHKDNNGKNKKNMK